MKQYHIVDLFAGVGGLSYGFSQLPGFRILAANEIEKDIAAAYSLNHPGVKMLNCDIADLTKERLAGALGGQQVDIVVGGPPCQSYSTLGKRRMDDRANLFLQYKRILQILQPQAFIFENVTGILSMDHGRLFQRVESEFRALGYDVRHDILNAVDFGVPQQRERVILVGMKGENNYIFPVPTHGPGKKPYVTLKDAIGDLPQLKSGESASHYAGVAENEFLRFVRAGAGQLVTEHAAPKNGAHLIRIMQTLQDGQSKDDLPEEIRPKSGYGNTYAKLWWERPSTTITRNFACPSSSRCIHPRDSRAMSIREGARLQSFPDDYRFYGSDGMKRLEIGNAVPPLLSVAIVQEMQSALKRKEQMPERSDPMRLTDQQIEETYRLIEQHHQEFQARHLGAQQGWCILSGERNDLASEGMKSGEYRLQTLEECYPGFTAERREEQMDADYWEALKAKYDYRCACCGSREGEPHRYWKNTLTKLQKGHKDPRRPLGPGNIIPQCSKCNQPDRNCWVYDDKGRVVGLANAIVVERCPADLQKEIYIRLYRQFGGKDPKDL